MADCTADAALWSDCHRVSIDVVEGHRRHEPAIVALAADVAGAVSRRNVRAATLKVLGQGSRNLDIGVAAVGDAGHRGPVREEWPSGWRIIGSLHRGDARADDPLLAAPNRESTIRRLIPVILTVITVITP